MGKLYINKELGQGTGIDAAAGIQRERNRPKVRELG